MAESVVSMPFWKDDRGQEHDRRRHRHQQQVHETHHQANGQRRYQPSPRWQSLFGRGRWRTEPKAKPAECPQGGTARQEPGPREESAPAGVPCPWQQLTWKQHQEWPMAEPAGCPQDKASQQKLGLQWGQHQGGSPRLQKQWQATHRARRVHPERSRTPNRQQEPRARKDGS